MYKKTIKIILSWFLVLIWMLVIFNYSNMNSKESNTKSKDAINKVIETTIETSNKVSNTEKKITIDEKQKIINKLNKPLRKCVHFTVYLILAILIANALIKINIRNKMLITIITCILYAITDEYHQTLVSGRTGQFIDVLIDTAGSVLGLIIYTKIIQKRDKKRF